jgi:hypothetical protein
MEQSPSWEANWLQLVKKFPAFYGPRRFITALPSARHLSLSWASPIQSTHPHPTSRGSVLRLSSHLRLGLPSGLLPSGYPTKTLYALLLSPIRATCPALRSINHLVASSWFSAPRIMTMHGQTHIKITASIILWIKTARIYWPRIVPFSSTNLTCRLAQKFWTERKGRVEIAIEVTSLPDCAI